jgi:protein O-mannosyl-transferase
MIAVGVLIILALVAAYFPAMDGGFIWDDDAHVTKPELQTARGLFRIWFEVGATQQYYPLLHTAFWVQHKLWGDRSGITSST